MHVCECMCVYVRARERVCVCVHACVRECVCSVTASLNCMSINLEIVFSLTGVYCVHQLTNLTTD